VANLEPDEGETTLIAEGGEPPGPALTAAIEACMAELPQVERYALLRTFNAERDLEPHPTLELATRVDESELPAIARKMIEAIGKHLPPPGYIDIVFDRIDD